MKKIFCTTCCLLLLAYVFAQSVGINNTKPHASAILDVKSFNKGVLLPRTSTTSRNAIANPAKGLILYDTTAGSFWFYNGAAWAQLSAGSSGWHLVGNTGTNASTNFIGTTDNKPLGFRINNIKAGIIDSTSFNTSFGFRTLDAVTSGTHNVAFGYKALSSDTDGYYNTAVGSNALRKNTSGLYNVAIGMQALAQNTTGISNTAVGDAALLWNSAGDRNTATGCSAIGNNTTGTDNTAIGFNAMANNFTGSSNTAVGLEALKVNNGGSHNVAIGDSAAFWQYTTIGSNIAIGSHALVNNKTGYGNTAIGTNAMIYNIGGNKNIAIGDGAGTFEGSPYVMNTISIGNDDILNGANNQVIIGNHSSTYYGTNVSWSTFSDARIKTGIKDDVKGLDFITRLKPVTYYKSLHAMVQLTAGNETPDFTGKYDIEKVKFSGFLAQDVEQAAVAADYNFSGLHKPKDSKDLYALSYETFVVPLVKAVQEQQEIISNQQRQIELLEQRLSALEKK